MPIVLNCPSCGGAIKVPDHLAGRKVKCPKCAAVLAVPANDAATEAIQEAAPAPKAPPASETPPPPSRRQRSRAAEEDRGDWEDDGPSVRNRDSQGGSNGMAIAGMVLGIVGFIVSFVPCFGWVLGIVMGILGATLSGIGLAGANKLGNGKGMAIAGLVLSVLAILWGPVWFYVFVYSAANNLNQAIIQAQKAAQNNPNAFNNQNPFFQDKGFQPNIGVPQGAPTPASGKVTLNNGQATMQGNLAGNDPRDRVRPSVCKVFTIDMVAGKTYQIDMIQTPGGPDPYLRLEDAAGKQLTQDDDGGDNLNAKIVFVCMQAGEYRIVATTFIGGNGNFTLNVSQR